MSALQATSLAPLRAAQTRIPLLPLLHVPRPERMAALARVQIARGDMPEHRILFKPGAVGLDHLIAHECGHLVRLWTVPAAERLLATDTAALRIGAIEQLGEELAAMANAGIPPAALSEMFQRAYPGLVSQVTNYPIDLRIERWIHERHIALRAAQRASLEAQLELNRRVLEEKIARATPPTIYRASCGMNCAFARGLAGLYGEPGLAAPYRGTAFWELGGGLLALLGEERDDAAGDVALVDRWAERLGVRGWYRWAPLESLPAA